MSFGIFIVLKLGAKLMHPPISAFGKTDADVLDASNWRYIEAKYSEAAESPKLKKGNSVLDNNFVDQTGSAILAKILKANEEGYKFALRAPNATATNATLINWVNNLKKSNQDLAGVIEQAINFGSFKDVPRQLES
tara:strand:- start:8054 stop:8461 length:408 start_codon:yes stop_codon:yes gene_type:complete